MSTFNVSWGRLLLVGVIASAVAACGSDDKGKNTSSSSSSSSSSSTSSSSSSSSSSNSSSSSSSSSSTSSSSSSSSSSSGAAVSLLNSDGSFAAGQANFNSNLGTFATATFDNEFVATITTASPNSWDVQLWHAIALDKAKDYVICYDAKATAARDIAVGFDTGPAEVVGEPEYAGLFSTTESLTTAYQSFARPFKPMATDASARFTVNMGGSLTGVSLDNVGVFEGSKCPTQIAPPAQIIPPDTFPASAFVGSVSDGKTLYVAQCAGCHGAAGAGVGSVPAINTDKVVFVKDAIKYSLESYIGKFMPNIATDKCDEQCAADVSAYIRAGFVVPETVACGTDSGVVCDNFESVDLDAKWKSVGTVSLSGEQKVSGAQSLKIVSTEGKSTNGIDLDLTKFTSLNKSQYGRMMLRVNGGLPKGDFTFLEASGVANTLTTDKLTAENRVIYRGRVDGKADTFMANYDTAPYGKPLTDCWSHGSAPAVPKDTWVCYEWHFDAAGNELTFWADSKKLDVSVKNKIGTNCAGHVLGDVWLGPAKFDKLHVGIDQYHPATTVGAHTIYVDDVVVDVKKVGCP